MSINTQPDDTSVECPRCGERNVIPHSCSKCRYDLRSRQSKETRKRHKAIDILLVVGLYAVIVLMVMKVSRDAHQSSPATRMLDARQQSPRELMLGGQRLSRSDNMLSVQGTVWNNTDRTYTSVRVPIYAFCRNDQVYVYLAKVVDLPPGARGAFSLNTKVANVEDQIIGKPIGRLVHKSTRVR